MELRPEEITKIIKAQIKNYACQIDASETGTVILVGDGIARASGLEKCMMNELIEFPGGQYGMAQNLEEDSVSIVILGDDAGIREGDTVKRTGRVVSVPVGEALIGRVVDALGTPIDGKGDIEAAEFRPIEEPAPGIIERKHVSVPLQTGIKAIDSMIPIGRGQRELIIGDRQTGKSTIATDTIINQKGKDGIDRDRRLSRLSVADDEFALSAPDGEHTVDGDKPRFERTVDGLAVNDAGRGDLDGTVSVRADVTFAVDGRAERVHRPAQKVLADGHARRLFRAVHGASLRDLFVVPEQNTADAVAFQILHHAAHARGELHDLPVRDAPKPRDGGNAVADGDDRSELFRDGFGRPCPHRVPKHGDDVAVLFGNFGERIFELTEPAVDAPIVHFRAHFEAESAREGVALHEIKRNFAAVLFAQKGAEALLLRLCRRSRRV